MPKRVYMQGRDRPGWTEWNNLMLEVRQKRETKIIMEVCMLGKSQLHICYNNQNNIIYDGG